MANQKVRRSARKREPPHKFEPVEAPSPSRPAKKRKGNAQSATQNTGAPSLPPPEAEAEVEAHDHSSDDEEDRDGDVPESEIQRLTAEADSVIPYLLEAEQSINAQKQHADNHDKRVQAYAKIAGRTWTYYAKDVNITIGRQGDKRSSQGTEGHDATDEAGPAIDLGPGKHVSREHASIRFDHEDGTWRFFVHGRNGAKVNDQLVRKGQQAILSSGDVIEVAGTEMIFIAATGQALVQDTYLQRMKNPQNKIKQEAPNSSQHASWSAQAQSHAHPPGMAVLQYPGPTHISPYGPPVGEEGTAVRPLTPTKPPMQHPYLAQAAQTARFNGNAPAHQQPFPVESNEQIDYASDASKDVKPPMSYATLIAQAILAGPNEKSSLNGIYEWIKTNFAYYRHIDQSWQNSIRHNLSLNQAFQKVARETHEPGKGGMWYITPEKKDEFKRMGWKMTSRGGARPSSNPSSPAPNKNKSPKRRTPPHAAASTGQPNQTPPGSTYAASQPSQTPLRQSTSAAAIPKIDPTPQLMEDNSPLPLRQSFMQNNAHSAQSPPMLSSGALLEDPSSTAAAFAHPTTPAPRRHEFSFNAPSTAKLPSQYLLQSSPAPFWKDFGTPALLPQTSPVKAEAGATLDVPASSSPPRDGTNGSPTRTRPRQEVGLGIQQSGSVNKDQPETGQLDLMGNFPKIGDSRAVNPAH